MYRFLDYTAQMYMTAPVRPVDRGTTMRELEALFRDYDFNAFPVVEDGVLLGMATKLDFLKNFAFTADRMVPPYEELMRRRVGDVMTTEIISVTPSTRLTRVLETMVAHRTRSLPVVGADGKLAGIISREDVMRALDDATRSSYPDSEVRPGASPSRK
ncbi:MAG TPA: CBS domain-containing protein [Hyphomicrobiales bacterium]|jgi:CBS domain-containing protein